MYVLTYMSTYILCIKSGAAVVIVIVVRNRYGGPSSNP